MHRILTWRKVTTCKVPDNDNVIIYNDKGYIGYSENGFTYWKTDYKDNYLPTATHWAFLSTILEHEDIKNAIKNSALSDIQENHLL